MPVSLADPNALDREGFVAVLGEVFEHAPWIAEAAYVRRPFGSRTTLRNALVEVLAVQTPGQITQLLNGHPDLVGRPSPHSPLTAHSAAEQKSAGIDEITPAEAACLALRKRQLKTARTVAYQYQTRSYRPSSSATAARATGWALLISSLRSMPRSATSSAT